MSVNDLQKYREVAQYFEALLRAITLRRHGLQTISYTKNHTPERG